MIPAAPRRALAADANSGRTQRVARRSPARRQATLAAFAADRLASAHDDVIDLYVVVIGDLLSRAERAEQRQRLATMAELDNAARLLASAATVILDPKVLDSDVRAGVYEVVGAAALQAAIDTIVGVVPAVPGAGGLDRLRSRYSHVRRFVPDLLRLVTFASVSPDSAVLAGLDHLPPRRRAPSRLGRCFSSGHHGQVAACRADR